jgi:hypothetical protein
MVVKSTSGAAALVVVALLAAASASAAWMPTRTGAAFSRATAVGQGNIPTAAKANGKDVRVTWTATTLTNGAAVGGYLVRRYNALTSAEVAVTANCSGTIAALTCTENNVGKGSWQYTITPTVGNWRGTESAKSAAVAV